MVQKEFFEKLTASPGNIEYSVVSVFSQYCFDIDPLFDVDKNSFLPPPKIGSKVIRLKKKGISEQGNCCGARISFSAEISTQPHC